MDQETGFAAISRFLFACSIHEPLINLRDQGSDHDTAFLYPGSTTVTVTRKVLMYH